MKYKIYKKGTKCPKITIQIKDGFFWWWLKDYEVWDAPRKWWYSEEEADAYMKETYGTSAERVFPNRWI